MTLLVAGSGYVGTALALRRRAAGERVYGLRRNVGRLPAGVEPVAADLTDPTALRSALPDDVDEVAYTAAADGGDLDGYRRAYVDGLANLLRALDARGAPVRRVVFTSSTGVWGDTDGGWVDEATPANPARPTGEVLLEAERTLTDGPFPGVTVRLAGIYGPGRTRLVDQVRRGEAPRGGDRWTNRIHRDDCAGVVDHVLRMDAPAPLYLGVDHAPVALSEVRAFLADELGVALPAPAAAPGGGGRTPGAGKRCRNDRIVAAGYRFLYPTYREGYAAMLAETAP